MITNRRLTRADKRALRSLYDLGVGTRNEILTNSGLGAHAARSVIDKLTRDGWIRVRGLSASARGRPSQQYELNPDVGYSVGLSIEFESIRILAVDAGKNMRRESELPVPSSGDELQHAIERIPGTIEDFAASASLKAENLLAVGIAVPGMIDTERGVWLHGMRMRNIHHIRLREIVQQRFDVPVIVDDVARAVTHLQSRIGLGKGVRDFVLLHVGMGFGAGIVIDHKVYRGHHGTAGEIGHMVVDPDGYRCSCGKRGCLDTVVSIPGILRTIADRQKEVAQSPLGDPFYRGSAPPTLESILRSARAGDRFTISYLAEIGAAIADACERLVMILNPQKIIIAGRCAVLEPYLKDPIDHRLRASLLADQWDGFTVEFASYSPSEESHGAALLALDDYWNADEGRWPGWSGET